MSEHNPTSPAVEPSASQEVSGVDLRSVMLTLRKYAWLIASIAIVVTVGVAFWSIKLPKVYEATVSLEFDPNPPRPLAGDTHDVSDQVGSYWATQDWLNTQQHVLKSRQICQAVVRKYALHHDADFFGIPPSGRAGWHGVSIEDAAEALRGRITVVPVKDTRVVEVSVHDSSGQRAMTLANALAEAYIEKTKRDRLGATLGALEWLSTQQDSLMQELAHAERALYDFKREHNVLTLSLEDRLNITARGMESFSSSLTAARTKRIELEARVRSLREANAADPLAVHSTVISSNATVLGLREQYRAAVAEGSQLALRYGPNHPRVEENTAKIASIRQQMRAEIDALLDSASLDLREISRIETGVAAALEQTNQEALQLNLEEIEFNRLNRERENKSKLYGLLLQRTTETNLTRMLQIESVRVLDAALVPEAPIKPNVQLNIGLGATSGLTIGIAVALLLAFLDRTIKNAEQVESLGMTVLGIVPAIGSDGEDGKGYYRARRKRKGPKPAKQDRDFIVADEPTSAVAECCRAIRTNLTFTSADRPARTLLISSSNPQEGKTTVAISLAIAIAQLGKRVLLVDTDLRRPRIHRAFGVSPARGITSVLVGEAKLEDAIRPTRVPNLFILPCGPIPPNPSELLHTDRFSKLIRDAREAFDQVIFDSPPIAAVTDAVVIAPQVDGALLVARIRKTHRDLLASSTRNIMDVGGSILGVVLNRVDLSGADYGYKHYYYYRRDGYSSEPAKDGSAGDDGRRNASA